MTDSTDRGRGAGFWWAGLEGPGNSGLPSSVRERIAWYERHVRRQRIGFYLSEILIVLISASIPASAAAGASAAVTGVLGALVVVAAGMRQLFRWGENWIRAGGSLRALQAEVVRWSHGVGPYRDRTDATARLAEETEAIVLAETGDWANARRAAIVSAPPPAQPSEGAAQG